MGLRRALHDSWTLEPVRLAEGAPEIGVVAATVPGCVHTDLLAARAIPDPYLDENESLVQWVAESDWRYRTAVTADPSVTEHDRAELCFDGLDTLATIAIDGDIVASTANMHRAYRLDVTDALAPGDHELTVTFRSATRRSRALQAAEGDWPSSAFGRPFNYLRKMACSWGWDWGPWLTTAGLWRPVALHAWSTARFDSIRPEVYLGGDGTGRVTLRVCVERAGPPATGAELAIEAELRDASGDRVASVRSAVTGDHNTVEIDAGPVTPWWPHSLGDPTLYELELRLVTGDAGTGESTGELDRWQRRIGFRTIELDTTGDELGTRFTFIVNGVPIFVRGANWIPDDVFPSRLSPLRYRHRLAQAIEANIDLLRVWGGGIYEDGSFYDSCDELGLLVWQDFAFACAAYPEHLLAGEVEAEARDNIIRLCPHPSLALWNGNNENIWGYFDWGWQERLDGRSWGAGFYLDLLPRLVEQLDPTRPYWPGSPYSGSMAVAPNADGHGCSHIWDVWNQLDFERYRDHIPRFVAELGWQAPPAWPTLSRAVNDLRVNSPAMRAHQKATDGEAKLARGLAAHVGVPDDFDTWWYATQLLQARAVRTAIEHFRSLRGHCMGTIWWQLNDCWPVTSWAVIDGDGHPKPAWYALRNAYRSQLLTIQPRGSGLAMVAVNDGADPWPLAATARRLAMDGTALATTEIDGLVVPPRDKRMMLLPSRLSEPDDPGSEVLVIDDAAHSAWWWFGSDRESLRPHPRLTVESSTDDGLVRLDVTSDVVVRDLVIYADRLHPAASINRQVVSLIPGRAESFHIRGIELGDVDTVLALPYCWSVADLVTPTPGR
jgi:beta-mannosidase